MLEFVAIVNFSQTLQIHAKVSREDKIRRCGKNNDLVPFDSYVFIRSIAVLYLCMLVDTKSAIDISHISVKQ